MPRYERDFRQWNDQGRYSRDQQGGQAGGYGRGGWGAGWENFPGEGAWMGESSGGLRPGYDYDYGGGFGSGYAGYGRDFSGNRGGYGDSTDRGPQGREYGYGGGFAYYGNSGQGGGYSGGERGGQRQSGEGSTMRAADIMTEEPRCVSPETTLAEVSQMMRDLDVGIIPVVESEQNRRLRGVITDRDITIRATAEGKDARTTRVSEVMTSEVETVNKNDRVREVLAVMRREQVKRVPVTDREGRLVGIIAEADLLADFEGHEQEHMLETTLERVYEPDRSPRRSRGPSRTESTRPEGMAAGGRGFDEQGTGRGRSGSARKRADQE